MKPEVTAFTDHLKQLADADAGKSKFPDAAELREWSGVNDRAANDRFLKDVRDDCFDRYEGYFVPFRCYHTDHRTLMATPHSCILPSALRANGMEVAIRGIELDRIQRDLSNGLSGHIRNTPEPLVNDWREVVGRLGMIVEGCNMTNSILARCARSCLPVDPRFYLGS